MRATGRTSSAKLTSVYEAATAIAARPMNSDAAEYALRSAAETLALTADAVRAGSDHPGDDQLRDALASARATTEAIKFVLAARGRGRVPRCAGPRPEHIRSPSARMITGRTS